MPVTFGNPGDLRKTFNDKKFDLLKFAGEKVPCPLKAGVNPATAVVDGQFLAPDGNGKWDVAADADRALALVFTANSEIIVKLVTSDDEFPGEDRTDTPTGLFGEIEAIWPVERLFTGATGGGNVVIASYAANAKLTVKNGKLCPANFGTNEDELVVGYVIAPSTVVGSNSVAARVHIK